MGVRIGIYGGTFDPIHFGHLNLAFELMEKAQLNEVWFVLAQVNPHKMEAVPATSFAHRLNMLKLALQDIASFKIKDLEGQRPPPSYTLHTLQALLAAEDHRTSSPQFYLLLGEDAVPGFFRWHQPHQIVKLVPLLIGSRIGYWHEEKEGQDHLEIREAIQKGWIKTRVMDISSTDIRSRLSKKLYCGHLVPCKVLEYIEENCLYKSNY